MGLTDQDEAPTTLGMLLEKKEVGARWKAYSLAHQNDAQGQSFAAFLDKLPQFEVRPATDYAEVCQ